MVPSKSRQIQIRPPPDGAAVRRCGPPHDPHPRHQSWNPLPLLRLVAASQGRVQDCIGWIGLPHSRNRMEPTVRNPGIESAIGCRCSKLESQQTIPERRLVSSVSKFSRRERNFWMQRLEAKNPPERPLLSAETGNVENRRQESP